MFLHWHHFTRSVSHCVCVRVFTFCVCHVLEMLMCVSSYAFCFLLVSDWLYFSRFCCSTCIKHLAFLFQMPSLHLLFWFTSHIVSHMVITLLVLLQSSCCFTFYIFFYDFVSLFLKLTGMPCGMSRIESMLALGNAELLQPLSKLR